MNDEPIPLEDEIYEEEIEVEEETSVTMAMWGEITGNIDNQTDLKEALDAKQDNLTQAQLDAVNSGINSTKVETYEGYQAQINTKASQSALDAEAEARRQADSTLQGKIDAEETARKASDKDIQDVLDGETLARQNADIALGGRIDTEIHDRQVADIALQGQIDAITSKSDVVDVVATYADLQAYDTQHLGDNDVIKVLDDETHQDALTYYRWSTTTQTWTYIGQEAPYYSKSQTDTLLLGKQNTIDSSHKLSADLVDDTSTTNKFVTASDITNWNGKQDALTAGTGIDITSGIISTPAIVPEVVTELPTTGAEGKLYLTPKAHTTSTATGNPITATITDGAGQIESFQLDGDTLQDGEPAPDSPVAIQTVTGEQTVEVAGKNLFSDTLELGSIDSATGASSPASNRVRNANYVAVLPNTEYTISNSVNASIATRYYSEDGTYISGTNATSNPKTITTPANATKMRFVLVSSDTTAKVQIELGSTASAYTPYSKQTLPISLGSIELCKLGDYQDYIYKDGENWKIHKAVGKYQIDGSENWIRQTATDIYYRATDISVPSATIGYCNYLRVQEAGTTIFALPNCIRFSGFATDVFISPSSTFADAGAFATWLGQVKPIVYYPLATATDTTITDQTLIAQLEAIRTASLENGTNTITNTATGTNLAGDMEIGYFGFNPTNRYDKFIWLNLNNNYEQIGGE